MSTATFEELDERTELVWSARTRADLGAATQDLPRRPRGLPPLLWPFWPAIWLARTIRRRVVALRKRRRAQLPRH